MIEFPLLDIWSKIHHKVIVPYYTESRGARAVKKAAKLNILFRARRLKAHPSARAASQLTHLACAAAINCQQCACTASNAHVRLQVIEYLNISGLVIDFATSPVRTGNSFFAPGAKVPWNESFWISCSPGTNVLVLSK